MQPLVQPLAVLVVWPLVPVQVVSDSRLFSGARLQKVSRRAAPPGEENFFRSSAACPVPPLSSIMHFDEDVADHQSGTLSWRVGLNSSDRVALVIYAQPKFLTGGPSQRCVTRSWRWRRRSREQKSTGGVNRVSPPQVSTQISTTDRTHARTGCLHPRETRCERSQRNYWFHSNKPLIAKTHNAAKMQTPL